MKQLLLFTLLICSAFIGCDESSTRTLCNPGETICDGDDLYRCNINSEYELQEACGANHCIIGENDTVGDHCYLAGYDECYPGQTICQGNESNDDNNQYNCTINGHYEIDNNYVCDDLCICTLIP
jgi:hypothetical protein